MKILTAYSPSWKELHDITYPSKVAYSRQWGMEIEVKEYIIPFSFFDRSRIILEAMEGIPENDWIWWIGSDALIMNQAKSIRELTPFKGPIVVCNDIHGINDDSMFFKKCPEVRFLLKLIDINRDCYEHFQAGIQWAIDKELINADARQNQGEFNSYLYSALYGKEYHYKPEEYEKSGGDYKEGHLILHFPGMPYARKVELAKEYAAKINFL